MLAAYFSKTRFDGTPCYRDNISIAFAFFAVLIPNILFLLISPFFLVGRLISPFFFLAAGMISLFVPVPLAFLVFVLAAAADLALIIMLAFSLPLDVALDSTRYVSEISPASSNLYIGVLAAVLLTTTVSAFMISSRRAVLRDASLVPAFFLAVIISGTNYFFTWPYMEKPSVEFDSARTQSGLTADMIAERQRNLLIVMVEGLGAFAHEDERDRFKNLLMAGDADGRFAISNGSTYYNGSTTGATARELCGQWGDYLDFLASDGPFDCLPNQLRAAGYATTAFHGFGSDMFRRDIWYPRIGFENLAFMTTIERNDPDRFSARCGSVFRGLCDQDVAALVHQHFESSRDEPQLVYWLTLNSHIPFVAHHDDTMSCRTARPKIKNHTVCELSNIWASVFESVNEIANDKSLPPMDILIVGDHHTPLWERAAKNRFLLHKVDWYLMRSMP